MGRAKDQLIEQMEEEREDLERALDDIEAFGELIECPSEQCDNKVCTKLCFIRSCFDWCLTHSYPSVEDTDGTVSVTVRTTKKDAKGQVVSWTGAEERRVCGHEDAKVSPGDCKIIASADLGGFDDEAPPENLLWQLEEERRMGDIMARDSP